MVDETVGGLLRVCEGGDCLEDVGVGDFVDKAVAAEQEPVATDEGQCPPVDFDVGLDAEGAGDDVAARVGAGFFFGDVAGRHQLLHVAVVNRDASQAAVAQQVGA